MPDAVNCSVVPIPMLGVLGVTSMVANVAGVTVRVMVPTILPDSAVMVAVPADSAVASPEGLIEATAARVEPQATDAEISFFEPSLYTPVAENWAVKPTPRLAVGGATE